MAEQMDTIQELVDDAVAKGATLHCGGSRNTDLPQGQFYRPTLLSGVTAEMRIYREEVFGPVMTVIEVPRDSDAECVKMVNDCPFGLGASVYAAEKERAVRIGERINSGMFTANDFGVNYLVQSLPFGGVKESGFGRFAGEEGMRACCVERSVVVDRIPGVRTEIPEVLDYPIVKEKGMKFGGGLVNFIYGESWWGKVRAVRDIIAASK